MVRPTGSTSRYTSQTKMSRALGRYELLRPLARGGMGEVYLARRRAAGVEKWLVVKRMRPERAGDARFLDLFMREARLSMSLAHQNIVPVFDFGRIDDQVFLAMERIEGKDLGSALGKTTAPLSPMLAAFIAGECCQALADAHRRRGPDGAPLGIVHRDVTPRNVLLSWSGEVKLTDFGIAALAGDARGSAVGTPAYRAPEQARGEPCDARTDVYAVGLVLREALTGKRARGGADRDSTLAAAREGTLEPWPDGFEGPLREIVDKATATSPDDRFPDARAMLEELDHFIVGERAGKKAEAPARQLAAWLASLWQDEREDAPIEEAIESGHLVSFLDDGALDVVGTGTQRSMALTAADEAPATMPSEPPKVEPAPAPLPAPAPAPAPVEAKPKRPPWLLPALAIVPVAAVIAIVAATRHGADPEKLAAPPAPAPVVPPPVEVKQPEQPPPPPPVVEEVKAPPVEVKRPVVIKKDPKKVAVAPVKTAPALPTHKALIGSQPWSYFTVDSDPTQHTTGDAIQLTAGPHTIHFTGQPHFHADQTVTITVPDDDSFRKNFPLEEKPASP